MEELKVYRVEAGQSRKEVVELSSYVCTLGEKMKLQLLFHLVEEFRRIRSISVLDAPVYEQFDVHTRTAYQVSPRWQANSMQQPGRFRDRGKGVSNLLFLLKY